eukprot:562737-Heterocapsa_arctica.AAC.1
MHSVTHDAGHLQEPLAISSLDAGPVPLATIDWASLLGEVPGVSRLQPTHCPAWQEGCQAPA